jgi:ABC-2 type transport system permease protein
MRSAYAIYRKEMGHYFVSPLAYVIVGVFLLLTAFFFFYFLNAVNDQAMRMDMQGMQFGAPPQIDVPAEVMRAFFGLLSSLILFLTPILTMGVYAEERRRGTMELLMTSPVTELEIVLGKFLASLTLFVIMLLPTAAGLVYLFLHSDPAAPWRMLLGGYLGVLLLGGGLLALGHFISSLTESQIIAAVLTFAAFLFVWVLDIGSSAAGGVGDVLSYLSVIRHYDEFIRGVIDTSSLVYFVSFLFLFVFLTIRSVDSMRWRRA